MEPLLLLVAQILEVRVDDLAFLRTRRALARPAGRAGRLTLRLGLAVHDLRELVGRAGQVLLSTLHPLEVLALQRLASVRSVEYTSESVWLRTSISCFRFESSAALVSASFTIRSISSLVSPDEAVMVMFCCLPVALSCAATFKMPFASISNVTSICGI